LRLFTLILLAIPAFAEDAMHEDVLDSFQAASTQSEQQLRGSSMTVDITAQVPRLEKTASLQGIRAVSNEGQVTFSSLQLSGDNSVRHEIIARYLSAEENVGGERDLRLLALTPANYKFRFHSIEKVDGADAYLFSVKPRHKREGSFEGNLWIDTKTSLPLRESGRVIQHSIFLRRLTMVRKFRIIDRTAVPERTDIEIDTRLVGKAQLTVKLSAIPQQQQQGSMLIVPDIHLTAVQ
jgi:hypothetical protein